MADQVEVHNAMAGRIVSAIVRPVIESGGSNKDVMILTESVLVGVALACIRLGGDEAVLDVMFAGARDRLAQLRLGHLPTAGEA